MSSLPTEHSEFDACCHACDGDREVLPDIAPGLTLAMTTMIVCTACGNKRCPHATDHRHPCTGSNEIGQVGSLWGPE